MARTIARFEVERDLATTPLGTISKARDPKSGRELVLRTVRLDAAGAQEFLLRLKQQAKAASALKSPNIAALYGGGTHEDLFFVALEYVPGASLRELIARGQHFSPTEFIDLARQVCSALDHAQHRDLFHAALHPGNILVEMDGTAKIMDFGIPKDPPSADDERCAYLSPEQLNGGVPDLRSNLFSWGAILYEVATGRKAFAGTDRNTAPTVPHAINGSVPAGIGRAIMKALANDPADRYQSGSEFVSALENHKTAAEPAVAVASVPTPLPPKPQRQSAYVAMPPVPPRPLVEEPPLASPAPASLPPVPETLAPVIEHVYSGPAQGADIVEPAPAVPPKIARARTELKRAVQGAAATLRAPQTEARVKKGLPYAVLAMAAMAVVLLALAAYYFIEGRVEAWRAQQPVSAPVASAPEPQPAVPPPAAEEAPPVTFAEAEPEPEPPERAADIVVKRPAKKPPVRKQPVTPASAVLTTGEVAISSLPDGAQVQVDGRGDPSWRTPLLARNLTPGAHTITLTMPGFAVQYQTVQVEAGKRTTFAASLTELGATVTVSSRPPGARIIVDGKDTGRVTPTKLVLEKGSHTFRLLRTGYFEFASDGQFVPGQNAEINAALKIMGNVDEIRTAGRITRFVGRPKDMASVQIATRPKGARVVINGREMDKSTPAEFFLPSGEYEVVVTATGYKPLRRVLTLDVASRVVIDESLQK